MIHPDEIVLLKSSGQRGFEGTGNTRMELLLKSILAHAIHSRATDIHIQHAGAGYKVRLRVDGFLRDVSDLDVEKGGRVIGSIKVLCDLDISKRSRGQDGSFGATVKGRAVQLRVSSVEEMQGEKMVIRILDTAPEVIDLKKLGTPPEIESDLRAFISRSQGVLLVSGPTGCGKSTTLYSMLREVDRKQRNVLAIEDPVEYQLEYVTRIPVNPKQGVTFADALRTALRQDPNILMIGEIRDAETAGIALQSGQTGHLVFSTVHARDAAATVGRLIDLGTEPRTVADTLNIALAQRLVRVLCPRCRIKATPDPNRLRRLGVELKGPVYDPFGCSECEGVGYRGRTGVFELMRMSPKLRELVRARASEDELRKVAEAEGMKPLLRSAMEKVATGTTSLEEVERAVE